MMATITRMRALCVLLGSAASSGCTAYIVPGRGADMALFAPDAARVEASRPTASFPASLAVVRVQAPAYWSYSVHSSSGAGKYSIVAVRDIEQEQDFERLAKLPGVRAIASVNEFALPHRLDGADELRRVAAELHAELVLAYTLDTVFVGGDHAAPLTSIALAPLPTDVASVDTTAAAVLLDTRTGYVYATAQAVEHTRATANSWWSRPAIDAYRRQTERIAFERLLAELERTWGDALAARSAASSSPGAAPPPPPR